jgi:hypothetical protein
MPQQPEVTSPSYSASPAPLSGDAPEIAEVRPPTVPQPQRIPPWLVRAELYLRVLLRMYIGLAVCYAPWSPFFWDQNPLWVQFPNLAVYAANGAVRGLISGLGLLNLWIAFKDAMHYRGK